MPANSYLRVKISLEVKDFAWIFLHHVEKMKEAARYITNFRSGHGRFVMKFMTRIWLGKNHFEHGIKILKVFHLFCQIFSTVKNYWFWQKMKKSHQSFQIPSFDHYMMLPVIQSYFCKKSCFFCLRRSISSFSIGDSMAEKMEAPIAK